MDQRLAREQSPPDIEAGLERLAQQLGKRLGDTVCRRGPELVAIVNRQMTVSRAAEAVRFLQNRIEHGREIAGRGIDHPQHLGGGSLLFQRFARLGNEPRVLHREIGRAHV